MLSRQSARILADAVDHGMGEAMLHWREYVDDPNGFRLAARRATDRAKAWLRREKRRRKVEERSVSSTLALAGAMYGREEVVLPDNAADLPVLVQLELDQLRRLVDALDKPERTVVEARYWRGEPGKNLSWPEVALMVGKNPKTVRAIHERALSDLRSWMA